LGKNVEAINVFHSIKKHQPEAGAAVDPTVWERDISMSPIWKPVGALESPSFNMLLPTSKSELPSTV